MNDTQSERPADPENNELLALTGIAELDHVLGGGLKRNRLYLVEGTPGTGKTTLAVQFLLEGQRLGERGMYITLSETADELRSSAASHGWSLDDLFIVELIPEADLADDQEQTLFHPAEFELGEATRRILDHVDQENPARLVIDGLSELRLLAQTPLRYRRQILALKSRFTSHECTVLLLDDQSAEAGALHLRSTVHGVITLDISRNSYGAESRSLTVAKLRGTKFRGGQHDYTIETGGLMVYPRLLVSEHHTDFAGIPVGTGISQLDLQLGGGLVPGTSTLFMGPAGTGKTSIATHCMFAALQRGVPAAVFMFDEELGPFLARSASPGMDLRPYLTSRQLQLRRMEPAALSPGQFVHYVRQAVEVDGAQVIFIDSLNGYIHAMPNADYLVLQMHELLSYLSQHDVVTLLVLGQHGLVGAVREDVDLSYLSDTIVLLRYFEAAGMVCRGLSVIKTPTSRHEASIREFQLGHDGVTIGAILNDLNGVLSGTPVYHGSTRNLMQETSLPPTPSKIG